jgi:membrane protein
VNIQTWWSVLKDTFSEWQEDKASRLAAALAYYTIFSMAPLIIIVLGIVGYLFGRDMVGSYMIEQISSMVGPEGAAVFQTIVESASQPATSIVATVIGLVTLLLGALGMFGQLQDALNTVWGVAPKPGRGIWGFLQTRLLSFTMVLGIGFLLLVSLILSSVLSALNTFLAGWTDASVIVLQVVNFVVSFGVITLLFAMIYKILPDVKLKWRDVWVGAAVTALLFSIGKFALGFYLGRQTFGSTYGAAGSLLIILLWVYYSAQILLFGAEFTQVYAKRFGGRVIPDKNAVLLTPEDRAHQGIPHAEDIAAAMRGQKETSSPSLLSTSKAAVAPGQIITGGETPKPNRWITLSLIVLLFGLSLIKKPNGIEVKPSR